MCQTKNRDLLRNGHAADLATQGHGIADIIDGIGKIENRLADIPVRSEVREMIKEGLAIHIASCDAARDDSTKPEDKNRFRLAIGKLLGFEAEGRTGVIITAVFWLIVGFIAYYVIPRVGEWLGLWQAK